MYSDFIYIIKFFACLKQVITKVTSSLNYVLFVDIFSDDDDEVAK